MCGRYVHVIPQGLLFDTFDLTEGTYVAESRYNIGPSMRIPVIKADTRGRRSLEGLRWGLRPCWAKPEDELPLLINARAETVTIMPAFRSAYKTRRCIIPVSGYYEWKKLRGGSKQPYYFTRADGAPMALAGLWDEGNEGEPDGAAIITTAANRDIDAVHDRMPAILAKDNWQRWLSPQPCTYEESLRLLARASAGQLIRWPVSGAVETLRNDGPSLIEAAPVGAAKKHKSEGLTNWKILEQSQC